MHKTPGEAETMTPPTADLERDVRFKTVIHAGELDRIAAWVAGHRDRETGGELFGFWTHSGAPVIQFAGGPGPTARHEPAAFYQDRDYLRSIGGVLRDRHGMQHIGEWHSHHGMGLDRPSAGDQGDEGTVRRALRRYGFPRFVLCIANTPNTKRRWPAATSRTTEVSLNGFVFTDGEAGYGDSAFVVLPGDSPVRADLAGHELFPDPPDQAASWQVRRTTLAWPAAHERTTPDRAPPGWYSDSEGRELLRSIHERVRQVVQDDVAMFADADRTLYFALPSVPPGYRLHFPDDFPTTPAMLTRSAGENVGSIDYAGSSERFALALAEALLASARKEEAEHDDVE